MGEPIWMQKIRRSKGGARLIAKYQRRTDPDAGERLPDFVHVTGHEYFRLDQPKPRAFVKCVGPPGEHEWDSVRDLCPRCGLTSRMIVTTDDAEALRECVPVAWWACDPLGHWVALTGKGLPVTEHEDGTITVTGIDNRGPYEQWWRGAIHAGVWRGNVLRPEASHDVG